MSTGSQILLGVLLPLPAWLWLRRGVPASRWVLLDVAPLAAGVALILAVTARPVLAGGIVAACCAMLAIADWAKRATLAEPLVFTDGALIGQVARHPRFYLAFVPRWVIAAEVTLGLGALGAALALEPPLALGAGARLALLAAAVGLLAAVLRPPLPAMLARDPARDITAFGPLATFAIHARLAARERPARRAAHPPAAAIVAPGDTRPHLVLLQLESFCDPRRFGLVQALPAWDALGAASLARGRLDVPGFGANTMRTEFVVLTGLADAALGLDRLNPYFRFARRPVGSLAWSLRGAGWATACLHPFDARFFARDRVLPALGFERFHAAPDFAGAPRAAGLVTDAALGERLAAELAASPQPAFLYAITVAAHGPWPGPDPTAGWMARIAATDAMLGAVAAAARASARPVVIAAFGDHRPALPAMRGGTDTDYLIWRSDRAGPGAAVDLDAAALHGAARAAVLGDA